MIKPTIPEVVGRFARYFQQPGHGAWGSLHCILDDGNTKNIFLRREVEDEVRQRGDIEGADLIAVLRSMSRSQRKRLDSCVTKYLKEHHA